MPCEQCLEVVHSPNEVLQLYPPFIFSFNLSFIDASYLLSSKANNGPQVTGGSRNQSWAICFRISNKSIHRTCVTKLSDTRMTRLKFEDLKSN